MGSGRMAMNTTHFLVLATNSIQQSFFQFSILLPPTKEEGHVFAVFVCLLVRLLKNACMDLDEMLRVDRCQDMEELINF